MKGVATAATNPGGTGGSTTGGSTALSLAQMPVHEHFTNIRYQASGSGYRSAGLGGAGTAINTDSKGSGSGHTHPGNEPPYYCIAYIMRV